MPVRPLFFSCFLFTGFDAQIHGEVLGAGGGCLYICPNKNYKTIGLNFQNLSDCDILSLREVSHMERMLDKGSPCNDRA